jgi:ADP-ribose pyrophosphatase YjhB (NUDIX family)
MNETRPRTQFHHCPRCAAALPEGGRPNAIECPACGFLYFFNPTAATATFVFRADGKCLFIRRGREPGRGLLAPPGGFIDDGETAETGAAREIREEVGLEIEALAFLCSQLNDYRYRGVNYPVLDLFFTARAASTDATAQVGEVEGFEWLDPRTVDPAAMAFPSMQAALRVLQGRR